MIPWMDERTVRSIQDGKGGEVVADVCGINGSTIYMVGAVSSRRLLNVRNRCLGRPPKLDDKNAEVEGRLADAKESAAGQVLVGIVGERDCSHSGES
jgi:hypothetical protein